MNSDKGFEHKGIMEWNVSSGEIVWSDEAYKILGIVPGGAPFSLDDFFNHVHDDDREITKRAIIIALENKISNIFNFRFIRPDRGSELFIHSTWHVEGDGSGEAVKITGILQDVTKRGITA
ncbi:MAG: PAS domain-containing protein [Deltaproteobacteria bacterium]|nr:PAS domain-containing protein [Deltaproteobacteria bacterium]